jgi:hypothetical protein
MSVQQFRTDEAAVAAGILAKTGLRHPIIKPKSATAVVVAAFTWKPALMPQCLLLLLQLLQLMGLPLGLTETRTTRLRTSRAMGATLTRPMAR